MKNIITLIGLPSAGKSTIGKLLAEQLNYQFVDTDAVLTTKHGKISDIIAKKESLFTELEENAILGIKGSSLVISPGGSCILSRKAMQHLKQISTVVYLKIPFFTFVKRISKRGALNNILGSNSMNLLQIYNYRTPVYKKYADGTIAGDCLPEEILLIIKNFYA